MNLFFGIFIFIFGTCWGSFTNVLIDRTQNKKSIKGRSKCDYCGYQLSWFDNLPILSFLALKGSCRRCSKKLSWQYPLVEFLTGAVFLITFIVLQSTNLFEINSSALSNYFSLIYYLGVVYLLWIILVWDFKYMIIPDFLIIIGVGLTLIYQIYQIVFLGSSWLILGELFLGGLLLGGFFGILYWFSKGKWIGGGDVKLGFWLGLLVGYKLIYFLLLISYTTGALVAVGFLLLGSKKMKSEIPFGPFLVFATYLIIFYQDFILKIWHSLI